jgi:hypothetical protein
MVSPVFIVVGGATFLIENQLSGDHVITSLSKSAFFVLAQRAKSMDS